MATVRDIHDLAIMIKRREMPSGEVFEAMEIAGFDSFDIIRGGMKVAQRIVSRKKVWNGSEHVRQIFNDLFALLKE